MKGWTQQWKNWLILYFDRLLLSQCPSYFHMMDIPDHTFCLATFWYHAVFGKKIDKEQEGSDVDAAFDRRWYTPITRLMFQQFYPMGDWRGQGCRPMGLWGIVFWKRAAADDKNIKLDCLCRSVYSINLYYDAGKVFKKIYIHSCWWNKTDQ